MSTGARRVGDGQKETAEKLAQPRTLVRLSLLLLLSDGPGHGYDLINRLQFFGFECADTGAVYQMLRRLEDAGMVTSSWDLPSGTGPTRRVYELTRCGSARLADSTADLRIFQNVLDEFFARHPEAEL